MNTFFTRPRKIMLVGLCSLSLASIVLAISDKDKNSKIKVGSYTQFERVYSIPELNTLVQANLLKNTNKNLELNAISKNKDGAFDVSITDKRENKTREIELNKFGFSINGPMPRLFSHETKGKWGKRNDEEGNIGKRQKISLEEVTEKVQKRLGRLNNKAIKLGTVTTNEKGYMVTILASDDSSLVKRIQLNKTGSPEWRKRFKHKG